MAKAVLYTANTGAQAVAANSAISPGSVIRRFGCGINFNGNGIVIGGQGYYDVDADITLEPTVAGPVTVTLLRDGVAVPGATASTTAAAARNPVSLSIGAILRQMCGCAATAGATLTLQLTGGAANVTNVAIKVIKL